jgi:hypothetical protein
MSDKAPKKFVAPAWVEDEMIVWMLWDREKGTGLKCVVACAAGNRARVVNPLHKVDRWVATEDLRVPEDDSHTYAALSGIAWLKSDGKEA